MDNVMEQPKDTVLDEVDFNELVELEKNARAAEEQTNRIAGTIFRLTKDQELAHSQERSIFANIETKRRDLVKRYKLDMQKQWKVDVNSRKIVYV